MRILIMRKWRKIYPTKAQVEMSIIMMNNSLSVNVIDLFPKDQISMYMQPEITSFIWICGAEAIGESIAEIGSVAEVLQNRFFSRRAYFGLNYREIIFKSNCKGVFQFSPASQLNSQHNWYEKEPMSSWLKVGNIVAPYYFNQLKSSEPNMFYFHSKDIKKPSWADGLEIARDYPNMIFYREKSDS